MPKARLELVNWKTSWFESLPPPSVLFSCSSPVIVSATQIDSILQVMWIICYTLISPCSDSDVSPVACFFLMGPITIEISRSWTKQQPWKFLETLNISSLFIKITYFEFLSMKKIPSCLQMVLMCPNTFAFIWCAQTMNMQIIPASISTHPSTVGPRLGIPVHLRRCSSNTQTEFSDRKPRGKTSPMCHMHLNHQTVSC